MEHFLILTVAKQGIFFPQFCDIIFFFAKFLKNIIRVYTMGKIKIHNFPNFFCEEGNKICQENFCLFFNWTDFKQMEVNRQISIVGSST
jgi:hypothetical protein